MITFINILCAVLLISCISVLYFLFNDNCNENINDYDCVVTKNLGNGYYEVSVKTKHGLVKKEVQSLNHSNNIEVGESFKIRKYYYGYFIYNKI